MKIIYIHYEHELNIINDLSMINDIYSYLIDNRYQYQHIVNIRIIIPKHVAIASLTEIKSSHKCI